MVNTRIQKSCKKVRIILQKAEMIIGATCLGLMLFIMLFNIFFRYVLLKPLPFSDELNNYLFIWMSFLSAAYVMGNDGHVRVTALVDFFPKKIQSIIKLIMDTIMVVVFFLYITPSVKMLGRLKLSNMMRVPLKFVYAVMPIVFFLMCVHIIINMIEEVLVLKELREQTKKTELRNKPCC